jgi:hypothetical protein
MSGKLFAKIALSIATAGAAMLPMAGTSFAASVTATASVTAKVSAFHLSGDNAGGAVCVRTTPPLPGQEWACVQFNNQLFRELTELLLQAYLLSKTCSITWNGTDNQGLFLIASVECR